MIFHGAVLQLCAVCVAMLPLVEAEIKGFGSCVDGSGFVRLSQSVGVSTAGLERVSSCAETSDGRVQAQMDKATSADFLKAVFIGGSE